MLKRGDSGDVSVVELERVPPYLIRGCGLVLSPCLIMIEND